MKIPKFLQIVSAMTLWLLLSANGLCDATPSNPGNDKNNFGKPENFLFWTPEQQLAGYRNINQIFPTRVIPDGGYTLELPQRLTDLSATEIEHDGATLTVEDYFSQQKVAGLLVIKDGHIVYERYGLGNNEKSLWVSFSVAKSVTAMLIGAAVKDGYIRSVDDKVTDYLPLLKNSAYDQSTIRNLMQMSSGVEWNEDYADPGSDVNSADWSTRGLYEYLRHKPRVATPGEVFNYNTAETNLAGTLLRSAIGNNLATYLSEKIWKPFGMQTEANWMLSEPGGGETGGCCINATLRDYGRLGLFAMAKGKLADGTQVLPTNWMTDSVEPSKGYPGYGYFWWLNADKSFYAVGIFGQEIHINEEENVVIALHSARKDASIDSDWALQSKLMSALTAAVSD